MGLPQVPPGIKDPNLANFLRQLRNSIAGVPDQVNRIISSRMPTGGSGGGGDDGGGDAPGPGPGGPSNPPPSGDGYPPPAPLSLAATGGTQQVTLDWTNPVISDYAATEVWGKRVLAVWSAATTYPNQALVLGPAPSTMVYRSLKASNTAPVTDTSAWAETTLATMPAPAYLGESAGTTWTFAVFQGTALQQETWTFWVRNRDIENMTSPFFPADDVGITGSSTSLDNQIANTDLWLDLETNIVGLDEAVADLERVYGDTVSAAQSAAEAAAAASEAIQAEAGAIIAQGGAVTAKNDAQIAATSANTAKSSAQTFANSAATSATNAAGSASTASQASGVATTAKNAAAGSASAAATSATSAASYATSAQNASTAATSAELAAEASKGSAATSASAAATSATNASASASAASQSATAANTARLAAQTAESGAEAARTEAVQAKNDASGSAAAAATSATTAANSATSAGNSATAAAGSATLASTKATAAETASQAAQTARVAAESAMGNAAGSANAAATSASTATTKANEAGQYATAASASATTAATNASSALAYRNQAASSATTAAGHATAAAQDYAAINARLDNVGGTGVSVEQRFSATADSIEGLQGQWSVKIDNNGYISGFGLSSEPAENGTPQSWFIVRADHFAIGEPTTPRTGTCSIGGHTSKSACEAAGGVWAWNAPPAALIPFKVSGGKTYIKEGYLESGVVANYICSSGFPVSGGQPVMASTSGMAFNFQTGEAVLNNARVRGDILLGGANMIQNSEGIHGWTDVIGWVSGSWAGTVPTFGGATSPSNPYFTISQLDGYTDGHAVATFKRSGSNGSARFPVRGTKWYQFSADLQTTTAAAHGSLVIDWYQGSSWIGNAPSANYTSTVLGRIAVTAQAPANATACELLVRKACPSATQYSSLTFTRLNFVEVPANYPNTNIVPWAPGGLSLIDTLAMRANSVTVPQIFTISDFTCTGINNANYASTSYWLVQNAAVAVAPAAGPRIALVNFTLRNIDANPGTLSLSLYIGAVQKNFDFDVPARLIDDGSGTPNNNYSYTFSMLADVAANTQVYANVYAALINGNTGYKWIDTKRPKIIGLNLIILGALR